MRHLKFLGLAAATLLVAGGIALASNTGYTITAPPNLPCIPQGTNGCSFQIPFTVTGPATTGGGTPPSGGYSAGVSTSGMSGNGATTSSTSGSGMSGDPATETVTVTVTIPSGVNVNGGSGLDVCLYVSKGGKGKGGRKTDKLCVDLYPCP